MYDNFLNVQGIRAKWTCPIWRGIVTLQVEAVCMLCCWLIRSSARRRRRRRKLSTQWVWPMLRNTLITVRLPVFPFSWWTTASMTPDLKRLGLCRTLSTATKHAPINHILIIVNPMYWWFIDTVRRPLWLWLRSTVGLHLTVSLCLTNDSWSFYSTWIIIL